MIHYLINFVSMAVSIFPWLSFTLTYPGTLSSAHNVQIGGRYIEQVDHAKLLGVMIDNTMCWEHHINTICCIVSCGLSLLCCIKPYLNFHSALRFYNSCANNYFIYCSATWGNCSLHLLLWLLCLQRHAGWILHDADFCLASLSLFLKLKCIPIFDLIKYRKLFLLSAFSLIQMLLIALGTNCNFFLMCVDFWAVIQ